MRFLRTLLLIVATALVAGCTAPPPLNFSVSDVQVSKKKVDAELRSITVTLAKPGEQQGGIPTDMDRVTAYWKEALQAGLDRMTVFRDEAATKVSIQVKILAFEIPRFGAEMRTHSVARYEVIDRASGAVLYSKDVTSLGVVPAGYAFYGVTRARESINRAAQDNIRQFLQSLDSTDASDSLKAAVR
ncbi:UDP-N-acetylglucosamine acyltransferase [Ottowia sp. GY511]|uniref:UDP-N-acetylglucosamine acyltransferase n=1 Tax=Ottowia flava TaxID=2675430 RepID=A0ABW4KX00_9BURK|nr:UDP-N-acetylglucosamine acyltransferase [Ottowia sp. GY511]